jgi:hypothetical protein
MLKFNDSSGAQANHPTLCLLGLDVHQKRKRNVCVSDNEKYDLKRLHLNECVCQHVAFLCIGICYTFGGIQTQPYVGSFDPA